MTGDLHQRARDVLAKLSIVAEGSTTSMDTDGSHEAPDSRPPLSLERVTDQPAGRLPSRWDDPHGHWQMRFRSAWEKPERLYYFVLLAEEDLACRHHPGMRGAREATEGEILAFRGSVAEAAARFTVTMGYMRTVRLRNRLDPETGDPWVWPDRERVAQLPAAAVAREKEHALDVARGMLGVGLSQRRVSEATGIPRGTLQRLAEANPRPGAVGESTGGR